ncbi:class A beta-lactamase [Mycolicibacterium sp. S2-37]|uniref:class A beta-lactamase n=1 Tax=Mycolicibacterium sp. S2-37 TaxID=2810297 RepID=UPI001A942162|nr:class A beta-lactamase [Mycolicibacterium sp. S2-37]MBO0678811.1 class A beta-lactamase [Mycolicibacterium sp. S2-37]
MNPYLTRRQTLGGLLAVGLLASVPRTALATPAPDTGTLDLKVIENRHRARIGAYAVDLGTAATLHHRADERFAMCSTFKAYAAGRVLELTDQGRLDLRTPIPVNAADIVANSPVTEQRVGATMQLAEVCEAALTRSDNAAGNLLLRTIGGPGDVTAFARTLGDDQTRLDRWETELNSATPGDLRDTTTPQGLCRGYRQLLTGTALSSSARVTLDGWMRANVTSGQRFRAAVPAGWTTADKTGAGDYGSTNDAGLILGPTGQRVIAVVLTRSIDDQKDTPPLNAAIVDTVRLILDSFGYR